MYNILLVDDEKITLDYLSVLIPKQDMDWSVSQVCYDGISALEWLKENTVDLIITDIKMPEMNGLELCAAILKSNPQQKIVLLSGYDEFDFAQQALKLGAKDYLLKPISLVSLKETLSTMKSALITEQAQEYVHSNLMEQSEEGKIQIVSRLIQAVINNSYVETKSLHPIVHRMKISLLDGAGILMLLRLDQDMLFRKNIPEHDIPLYKYILYRLTLELSDAYPANIWVSLDSAEDVVVLLSADTCQAAAGLAKDFLQEIRKNKFPHMELSLSAGLSLSFEDILMVNDAYQEARNALEYRLPSHTNQLYIYDNSDNALKSHVEKSEPEYTDSSTGIVSKAKQYIHLHYAEPISLALIAEEIGVSPNYLSTLFHNEAGESYIKYLTGIRMKNAVSYMKNNPDIKIYEIAEKTGYVNVKHFSYVFKQYYSVSPGEYQQKRLWHV